MSLVFAWIKTLLFYIFFFSSISSLTDKSVWRIAIGSPKNYLCFWFVVRDGRTNFQRTARRLWNCLNINRVVWFYLNRQRYYLTRVNSILWSIGTVFTIFRMSYHKAHPCVMTLITDVIHIALFLKNCSPHTRMQNIAWS